MTLPRWFPKLQLVLICASLFILGMNAGRTFMPWWLNAIIGVSAGFMLPNVWRNLNG